MSLTTTQERLIREAMQWFDWYLRGRSLKRDEYDDPPVGAGEAESHLRAVLEMAAEPADTELDARQMLADLVHWSEGGALDINDLADDAREHLDEVDSGWREAYLPEDDE